MLLGDLVFFVVAGFLSYVVNNIFGIPISLFRQSIGL